LALRRLQEIQMTHAVFHRLAARADRLASHAAYSVAATIAADRHGLSRERVQAPPTPAEQASIAHAARGLANVDPQVTRVTAARHEAIYIAVVILGRGHRSVARVAGVSHTAVNKAVAAVEDRRDDPRFDRSLDQIQLQLMGA
jgi:hypothetical protein